MKDWRIIPHELELHNIQTTVAVAMLEIDFIIYSNLDPSSLNYLHPKTAGNPKASISLRDFSVIYWDLEGKIRLISTRDLISLR